MPAKPSIHFATVNMSILVTGSLAYDYIMDFPDSFKNHILPDQIHILSVSFVVPKMEKNWGGTAGNVAYNFKLLNSDPIIFSPLGRDAKDYLDYFQNLKINTDYIPVSEQKLTASAHIITDKDDNQITAFYTGATDEATDLSIENVKSKIDLALICATKKDAMIKHAKECYDQKIPFVFDPGQQITAFDARELSMLIGQAKFYIVNDYEMKLTQEKTGWDANELLNHVEVLIITLGERGSIVRTKDQTWEIKPCPPTSVDDPTGAGDAYRAGFFTAYLNGYDFRVCGQAGSVSSVYAVEHYGTQNHSYTLEEFKQRYEETYDEKINFS